MKDMLKRLRLSISGALILGFLTQIGIGFVWMILNFGRLQSFEETLYLTAMSKTPLSGDEYLGFLYPLVLSLLQFIAGLIKVIPYYCIVYALQIVFSLWAGYFMICGMMGRKGFYPVFGSFCITFFPFVLQSAMAVTTHSVLSSLFMLQVGMLAHIMRKKGTDIVKDMILMSMIFGLQVLIKPEFILIGILPLLFVAVRNFLMGLGDMKNAVVGLSVITVTVAVLIAVMGITTGDNTLDRPRRSAAASIMSRTIWPDFTDVYLQGVDATVKYMSYNEFDYVDEYADNVFNSFQRTIDRSFSPSDADRMYFDLASYGMGFRAKEVIHDSVWDVISYVISPVVTLRQLDGKVYDSYVGNNYSLFRENTPKFSKIYFRFGCMWFSAAFLLAAIQFAIRERSERTKELIQFIITIVAWSALLVVFLTLRGAGMMDYKETICLTSLWISWIINATAHGFDGSWAEEQGDN